MHTFNLKMPESVLPIIQYGAQQRGLSEEDFLSEWVTASLEDWDDAQVFGQLMKERPEGLEMLTFEESERFLKEMEEKDNQRHED